jgi:hypothetical protein
MPSARHGTARRGAARADSRPQSITRAREDRRGAARADSRPQSITRAREDRLG